MMRSRAGFTLVELLVSLAMLGVIMAAVTGLVVRTQREFTRQRELIHAQDNLRVADMFVRTVLRSALADPTNSSAIRTGLVLYPDPFTTGNWRSSIRVTSNFNKPDGVLTGDLEDVSIRVIGDTMKVRLRVGDPELPFLHPMRALHFTYYNENGDSITTQAGVVTNATGQTPVRRIRYVLTAPVRGAAVDSIRRESWVYLRNMR
jgi:prepilin-type N-terminal cleavage/methylation domain-containing protein